MKFLSTTRLFLSIFIFVFSSKAYPLDLYKNPKPQSLNNSCQSYAAMLALAAKNDPLFQINSFGKLNEHERKFKKILKKYGGHSAHKNWPKAMEEFTDNRYTLIAKYSHSDTSSWIQNAIRMTTIGGDFDYFINNLSGKSIDVVLTSVYELDGNKYNDGHIVAILGFTGNGLNSNAKMIVFNSAIKTACYPRTVKAQDRYKAGVIETNDFILKGFPKFLTMTLERK